MTTTEQLLALANVVRRVRTPEGAKLYGQPIGSIITRDKYISVSRLSGKIKAAAASTLTLDTQTSKKPAPKSPAKTSLGKPSSTKTSSPKTPLSASKPKQFDPFSPKKPALASTKPGWGKGLTKNQTTKYSTHDQDSPTPDRFLTLDKNVAIAYQSTTDYTKGAFAPSNTDAKGFAIYEGGEITAWDTPKNTYVDGEPQPVPLNYEVSATKDVTPEKLQKWVAEGYLRILEPSEDEEADDFTEVGNEEEIEKALGDGFEGANSGPPSAAALAGKSTSAKPSWNSAAEKKAQLDLAPVGYALVPKNIGVGGIGLPNWIKAPSGNWELNGGYVSTESLLAYLPHFTEESVNGLAKSKSLEADGDSSSAGQVPSANVDGLVVSKAQVKEAIDILINAKGIMVAQPLNKVGNPLANVDYKKISKQQQPDSNQTKPGFIAYLESLTFDEKMEFDSYGSDPVVEVPQGTEVYKTVHISNQDTNQNSQEDISLTPGTYSKHPSSDKVTFTPDKDDPLYSAGGYTELELYISQEAFDELTKDGTEQSLQKLIPNKPEAGKPEAGKPEAGKPEAGKPEAGKPEANKTEKFDKLNPPAGKYQKGKSKTYIQVLYNGQGIYYNAKGESKPIDNKKTLFGKLAKLDLVEKSDPLPYNINPYNRFFVRNVDLPQQSPADKKFDKRTALTVNSDGSASFQQDYKPYPEPPEITTWSPSEFAEKIASGVIQDEYGSTQIGFIPKIPTTVKLFGNSFSSEKIPLLVEKFEAGESFHEAFTALDIDMPNGWQANFWVTENLSFTQKLNHALISQHFAAYIRQNFGMESPEPKPDRAYKDFTPDGVLWKNSAGEYKPYSQPEVMNKILTGYNKTKSTDLKSVIKEISQEFGDGAVIGLYTNKMKWVEAKAWLRAWDQGDMAKAFSIETKAAGAGGHKAADKHPGAAAAPTASPVSSFIAPTPPVTPTTITWAAAVKGEVSANTLIPGDWTSLSLDASEDEIENYLIKAKMQYPEYLSTKERRSWVVNHRTKISKASVDLLSKRAEDRFFKDSAGYDWLLPSPVWKDNVIPSKSYTIQLQGDLGVGGLSGKALVDYWDDVIFPTINNSENWQLKKLYEEELENNGGVPLSWYKLRQVIDAADLEVKNVRRYHRVESDIKPGTAAMEVLEDQFGKRYIFKLVKNDDYIFRSEIEKMALELGLLFGFADANPQVIKFGDDPAAQGHHPDLKNKSGLIQNLFESSGDLIGKEENLEAMSTKEIADIASEHVFDWMLDNDDSHGGNMLRTPNGITGIDKGRTFLHFGGWQGLSLNASAADYNMLGGMSLISSKLWNGIRTGKISKDQMDAAYSSVLKKVKRIEAADPKKIRALMDEGLASRLKWSSPNYKIAGDELPQNVDQLAEAWFKRRDNLSADMDELWSALYDYTDYEKPEKPAYIAYYSGVNDPNLHKQIGISKVFGAAAMLGGDDWKNNYIHFWTEDHPDKDAGIGAKTVVVGEGTLNNPSLSKVIKKLEASTPSIATAPGLSPLQKTLSDRSMSYVKSWGKAVKKDTDENGWYNPSAGWNDYASFNSFEADMRNMAEFGKPAQKKFYKHIVAQIEALSEAREMGVKPDRKNSVYLPFEPEATESLTSSYDYSFTVKLAQTSGTAGAIEDGVLVKEDDLIPGNDNAPGVKGKSYYLTLASGETVQIRSEKTGNFKSQNGLVRVVSTNADAKTTTKNLASALAELGVSMDDPTDQSLELVYWNQMGNLLFSRELRTAKERQLRDDISVGQSTEATPAGLIAMYRKNFGDFLGEDVVSEFLSSSKHLPQFGNQDLANPDTFTGKPHWNRIDVDLDKLLEQPYPVSYYASAESTKRFLNVGAVLSTEERTRIGGTNGKGGAVKAGLSSSTDQKAGLPGHQIYTRLNQEKGTDYSTPTAFYSPLVMNQISTFSYNFDSYGGKSNQGNKPEFDIFGVLKHNTASSNETMVANTVTILNDIEILTFLTQQDIDSAVARLAELGINEIRGLPVRERFVLRSSKQDIKKALKKAREVAQWWYKQKVLNT